MTRYLGGVWLIAAVLIGGCAGETGDDVPANADEGAAAAGAADTFDRIDAGPRLEVNAPFPDLSPEPVGGGEPFVVTGWTAVALAPPDCGVCESYYEDWARTIRNWSPQLRFVTITERDVERVAATFEREQPGYAMYATERSIYGATDVFDEPVYALVDPEGMVRFLARRSGTNGEKLESVRRNHKYLSASDDARSAWLAPAMPLGESLEVADGLGHPAFDAESAALGVSPWYGVSRNAAGEVVGHVFAIERDTDCDVCDPLYLAVGVATRGFIAGAVALEPVISDGEPVDMKPLFEAIRGVNSNEGLAALEGVLSSRQADIVARKILATALRMADRITG